MKGLFDIDSPFMTGLSRIADLFILNVIYLICCIPVFTIGAATTGLYYVTLKMVRNEDCYTIKSFFKSFKENFKQATVIWLIILAFIAVLVVDFRIIVGNADTMAGAFASVSRLIMVVMLVSAGIVLLLTTYVFPVLSRFDNTIKATMKNALLMSMRHLPFTLLIILINALPVVLILLFPQAMILFVISSALCAYGCSFIFNKIFSVYTKVVEVVPDDQFSIKPDEQSFLFKNESNDEES